MSMDIIYYSFEGNCRELAALMAKRTGATLDELRPVKESVPQSGFMKYFKGGKASLFRETPELMPLMTDPKLFSTVVVGTPVWFGNMAPAVRSFLAKADLTGKNVALFSMHRGGPGKAVPAMKTLVEKAGGTVVAEKLFIDLRRKDADATRADAEAWAEALVQRDG